VQRGFFKPKPMNKLLIEDIEVTDEDIGSPVTYIPPHANGDASHQDSQRGTVSSFNDTYVFVKFHSPNGQACKPEQLVWG
jgi:hypothetical protein